MLSDCVIVYAYTCNHDASCTCVHYSYHSISIRATYRFRPEKTLRRAMGPNWKGYMIIVVNIYHDDEYNLSVCFIGVQCNAIRGISFNTKTVVALNLHEESVGAYRRHWDDLEVKGRSTALNCFCCLVYIMLTLYMLCNCMIVKHVSWVCK
jgi:hypothetical protein